MRSNKIISLCLSAAIALPLAAGVFVAGEGMAEAATTEVDYIGSSAAAETFDSNSGSGWASDAGTFSASASGNAHFGLVNVTEVAKPAVGGTISSDYSNYPTYASGSALETQVRGKTPAKTTYTFSTPVTGGKLYFSTDMYGHFDVDYPGGISLVFYDSNGTAFATVKTDSISGSTPDPYIRMYAKDTSNALDRTGGEVDWRGKTVTAFNIGIVFDIDNDTAVFSADYIGTDYKRKTDTQKSGSARTMAISDVAKIEFSYTGTESSKNFAWAFDNMKLYNTYVASFATGINIAYNYNGTSIKSDSIDISSQMLSSGDSYTYYAPAYFAGDDGNLYKTSNSSDEHGTLFRHGTTLSSGANTITENVSLAHEKGAYYYAEFDDTDPYARSEYISGGKVTAVGTNNKTLFNAEENGLYSVIIALGSANGGISTSGSTTTVTMGGKTETISQTANYPVVKEYTNILLDINETISVKSSNNRPALDYILIVKTGDYKYPEPAHNGDARRMEQLGRGTYAVYTGSGGVYLSWRLLGNESLANQAFDIYRDGTKIYSTGVHEATNYTDKSGTANSSYIVVPHGEGISGETAITPKGTYINNYSSNSASWMVRNTSAYFDIPITAPADEAPAPSSDGTKDSTAAAYTANDASVGDLDGDGEYEIVLKWDPSNSKDNSKSGLTSNVYIAAYELDGTELWSQPINLGKNIRAGAHYTQFIVYDLDGDGKAEVAIKTAPGSTDGTGAYVTVAGDTETIKDADNNANYRDSSGRILDGSEYLTIFDGQTGQALYTTDFIARGRVSDWGDSYGNRVDRFLAGVAYLNGTTPSLIMTRGYYAKSVAAAYNWDGSALSQLWLHESPSATQYSVTDQNGEKTTYTSGKPATTVTENITDADGKVVETVSVDISDFSIYGQGNHSLGVCDADGDGMDEIVFGSAVIDDDGTVLNTTGHGHGDAHHISDFDNNGSQDTFSVHEWESVCKVGYGAELRLAANGGILANQATGGDNGRGIMDNFLDDSSYGYAQFWTSGVAGAYGWDGSAVNTVTAETPESNSNAFYSFGIYWDGDLARELQEKELLSKLVSDSGVGLRRYSWGNNVNHFADASPNNGTKGNPCISADLFGDWREEVIFRKSDGTGLRVFVPAEPTEYRLYTLMHDSQYRTGVAIENVGYNQPPHTSYYIGSAALAKDGDTTLNYLAPAVAYQKITTSYDPASWDISCSETQTVTAANGSSATGWTASITNGASYTPYSFSVINARVSSNGITKTFSRDVDGYSYEPGAGITFGIIIQGLADEKAVIEVTAE